MLATSQTDVEECLELFCGCAESYNLDKIEKLNCTNGITIAAIDTNGFD